MLIPVVSARPVRGRSHQCGATGETARDHQPSTCAARGSQVHHAAPAPARGRRGPLVRRKLGGLGGPRRGALGGLPREPRDCSQPRRRGWCLGRLVGAAPG